MGMTRKTESEVWKAARFLRAKLKGKEIVFLCIGTQKITGDRFGPGTGTLLNDRLSSPCYIYGMLGSNLHAQNLERAVAALRLLHPKACFVALDAALGAAEEAALNGILGVGVSLDTMSPDADFSVVKEFFPEIFRTILANLPSRGGIFYNVNFPNIPASAVKGVRVGHQGMGHWEKEFKPWNADSFAARGLRPEDLGHTSSPVAEKGERLYMMVGDFKDDSPADDRLADHHIISVGYISVVAHNIDNTDREEIARLDGLGFNKNF